MKLIDIIDCVTIYLLDIVIILAVPFLLIYLIFFVEVYDLTVFYPDGSSVKYVCLQRPTNKKPILLDNGKYLILPDDCTFDFTFKSEYKFNK